MALFRVFEILILGAGVLPTTQLLIAFIALLLGSVCLRKVLSQRNNEIQPALEDAGVPERDFLNKWPVLETEEQMSA